MTRQTGVYALRSDPDWVVFDHDLFAPTGNVIGDWREYDCLGSLPLSAVQDAHTWRVRPADEWATQPQGRDVSGHDAAIELAARRKGDTDDD